VASDEEAAMYEAVLMRMREESQQILREKHYVADAAQASEEP
jgi:hypothetical protein